MGNIQHISGDYCIESNLKKKSCIPADFTDIFVLIIVRKHEMVMTVENQTYYSDYNQCQNYMCKNLAAATAIVKIGDHIPGPCKHREEHEHKVKDCQIRRADAKKVLSLVDEFGISPRLTFSNSLIREEHFCDKKCNFASGIP